jgi:hypothetical protein
VRRLGLRCRYMISTSEEFAFVEYCVQQKQKSRTDLVVKSCCCEVADGRETRHGSTVVVGRTRPVDRVPVGVCLFVCLFTFLFVCLFVCSDVKLVARPVESCSAYSSSQGTGNGVARKSGSKTHQLYQEHETCSKKHTLYHILLELLSTCCLLLPHSHRVECARKCARC